MTRPSRRRTASDLPGLDIAEQRSWQNYLHAALRFHTAMDRCLTEAHHLSVIDMRVLDILDRSADGAARMGDLADALAANPHHMTKRIHRLEERGLVQREQNSADRRGVVARITEEGRSVAVHASRDYAQGSRPISSVRCLAASSPPSRRTAAVSMSVWVRRSRRSSLRAVYRRGACGIIDVICWCTDRRAVLPRHPQSTFPAFAPRRKPDMEDVDIGGWSLVLLLGHAANLN